MPSDMEGETIQPVTTREQDQEELDATNRRKTLYETIAQAESAADLVLLVDVLELGLELAELGGRDPERHRRIVAAQVQLDQETAELAQLAASQAKRH
jgi:hypothetical protein